MLHVFSLLSDCMAAVFVQQHMSMRNLSCSSDANCHADQPSCIAYTHVKKRKRKNTGTLSIAS